MIERLDRAALLERSRRLSAALPPPPADSAPARLSRRLFPLPLLAAALMALAVVFVHDARPASADHEHTTILWHATLTVGSTGGSGCSVGVDDCRELLTDTRFTYEGATYTVTNVDNERDVVSAKFIFWLDKALPASLLSAGTLYVDGRALSLADFRHDADVSRFHLVMRPSPRIPQWEPGDKVLLTLSGPRPPAWSATLSPSDLSNFSGTGFGCQDGFLGCSQVLTGSNTFTYNGTSHTIDTIKVDGGVLTFATDLGQSGLRELTLNVDGTAFPLADAASNQWSNTGLTWSSGGSVELSLTGPPPTGVEISPNTLNVTEGDTGTFTVALTSDPGTDKTVQLVTTQFFQSAGEPGHVWDKNAVTVLPVTMTFTAGSSGNWATPQTVTVRAPGDADVTNEQLIIHVFEQKSSYGFVQCIGAGDYDYNGVTHVYHGNGDGDYCSAQLFDHGPVGGVYNAVNGVHVTVADSGVNFVIEPPTGVEAHAGRALMYDSHGNDQGRWLARFSWDAPGGSITVTGYDFQWRREGGAWPAGATSLSASDTSRIIRPNLGNFVNQSRGTVLGYRVRTRTADGASPWIEGTLTLDNPANLVRDLLVLPGNAGELSLSWSAPAGWPATDYEVQYKVAGASNWMSSDPEKGWVDANYTGGTDQLMTIPNLKDGTAYAVRVRAKSDWDFRWTVAQGTTSGTAPAIGGSGGTDGDLGVVHNPNAQNEHAGLIADVRQWRDDPCCAHNSAHTDRWDRVLLALGESVADASLEPMTASEAQDLADRGWSRWTGVAEALRELEAAAQNDPVPPAVGPDPGDSSGDSPGSPGDAPDEGPGDGPEPANPANQAPTVSATPADVSGLEAGATREVSLAGVFHDADGDALTITGGPDDDQIVTVEVASDGSRLTLTGVSEGTAIVLVFAQDPSGASVFTEFNVTVVAAPEPAASLTGTAARYDADSNGKIDVSEYRRAVNDYVARTISYTELLEVVTAYQAS